VHFTGSGGAREPGLSGYSPQIFGSAGPVLHYHSPQHGEQRLRLAARSLHGETILPSSSSLPDPTSQPQNESAAGASRFDRMEAELRTLQQQAQATQQSIKKLKTREPVDPYTAILSELPSASTMDSTVLGVASALLLALVLLWWYLWHRPQARLMNPAPAARRTGAPASVRGPQSEPGSASRPPVAARSASTLAPDETHAWDRSTVSEEESELVGDSISPFAKPDPGMGFDSEAAASEVMRVRKSLAEKRVARAHYRDRGDDDGDGDVGSDSELDLDLELDPVTTPTADPDLDLDLDLGDAPAADSAPSGEPELDLDLDPWRQPGEAAYGTADISAFEGISFTLPPDPLHAASAPEPTADTPDAADMVMDLPLEPAVEPAAPSEQLPPAPVELLLEPEPEPEQEPPLPPEHAMAPPAAATKPHAGQDYSITLALAEESTALGLWTEARELATEVLESDNALLVSEAQHLLQRIQQLQDDAEQDTIPWDAPR